MARFQVRVLVRHNNIEAADGASAQTQATTALTAVLPAGWAVVQSEAREADLDVGEWVVARRPDGSEAYAVVFLNAQNEIRLRFGDGTLRGINAFVRRAP